MSLSPERLSVIDAAIIFIPVYDNEDGGAVQALGSEPLWASLPAARAGQVLELTGDIAKKSGPGALAFVDFVKTRPAHLNRRPAEPTARGSTP